MAAELRVGPTKQLRRLPINAVPPSFCCPHPPLLHFLPQSPSLPPPLPCRVPRARPSPFPTMKATELVMRATQTGQPDGSMDELAAAAVVSRGRAAVCWVCVRVRTALPWILVPRPFLPPQPPSPDYVSLQRHKTHQGSSRSHQNAPQNRPRQIPHPWYSPVLHAALHAPAHARALTCPSQPSNLRTDACALAAAPFTPPSPRRFFPGLSRHAPSPNPRSHRDVLSLSTRV